MDSLVEQVLSGNRRSLARALTHIENEEPTANDLLAELFPHTGKAWILGVTGAPGTGKSSLVNALTKAFRQQGKTVAILAVDPTSPFSGGAILGDRIRMRDLSGDKGVFIRSMATRGSLGGLAKATRDLVRVMDSAGFDIIIVETVGAGQSEVDIVRMAQTTLVIEAPGLGDDVQAIKAGILEIADILVVNKADRPGAVQTVRALKAMLELGHPLSRLQLISHHGQMMPIYHDTLNETEESNLWISPIIQTTATEDAGIDDLLSALEQHRAHYLSSDEQHLFEQQTIALELTSRLQDALLRNTLDTLPKEVFAGIIKQIHARELAPQQAVDRILSEVAPHDG